MTRTIKNFLVISFFIACLSPGCASHQIPNVSISNTTNSATIHSTNNIDAGAVGLGTNSGIAVSKSKNVNAATISTIKADGGGVGVNQGTMFAPITTTVNNYYVPISNSITKEAFDALDRKLADATNSFELTRREVQLIAQALKDLDQRTSGIEKLPDGRTYIGDIITGRPSVVIENFNEGLRKYSNSNYNAAFVNFTNAIDAYLKSDGRRVSLENFSISQEQLGNLYRFAALTAQHLDKKMEANDYAESAVKSSGSVINQTLLATTLCNVAYEYANSNDFKKAEQFSDAAIKRYESIPSNSEDLKNLLPPSEVAKFYTMGAQLALESANNIKALDLAQKSVAAYKSVKGFGLLANALLNVGRQIEAKQAIQNALEMDPNDIVANRIMWEIDRRK